MLGRILAENDCFRFDGLTDVEFGLSLSSTPITDELAARSPFGEGTDFIRSREGFGRLRECVSFESTFDGRGVAGITFASSGLSLSETCTLRPCWAFRMTVIRFLSPR